MSGQIALSETDPHYVAVFTRIKKRVHESQRLAAMAVNSRLIYLYWEIGHHILAQQEDQGWGARVIDLLSRDLSAAFPKLRGFSVRNLRYMRKFAEELPMSLIVQQAAAQLQGTKNGHRTPETPKKGGRGGEKGEKNVKKDAKMPIVQQAAAQLQGVNNQDVFNIFEQNPAAQIPWSHQMLLLDKLSDPQTRFFYATEIVRNHWSRQTLQAQISRKLLLKKGKLTHNFHANLPLEQSISAESTFKDPYFLDFLNVMEGEGERKIQEGLLQQITRFLLELGSGFAFIGSQIKLEAGGNAYYLDLMFYHIRLKCNIIIDLKSEEFIPEHVGKMQFYLAVVDEQHRAPEDNPAIGLILCKVSNKIVAEYALRYSGKPIGISEYRLSEPLPEDMQELLPSVKEIELALSKPRRLKSGKGKQL